MTDHRDEAERLLRKVEDMRSRYPDSMDSELRTKEGVDRRKAYLLACAQVHATLALGESR